VRRLGRAGELDRRLRRSAWCDPWARRRAVDGLARAHGRLERRRAPPRARPRPATPRRVRVVDEAGQPCGTARASASSRYAGPA
jgi:hypothetical protein